MMKMMHAVNLFCFFFLVSITSGTAAADAADAADTGGGDTHKRSRDRVTFNYGWKFRTGLTDWADPDETPPTNVDPGRSPPESLPDYDTHNNNTWQSISLPHDGLIASRPSQRACPNGCSGRSYLPRHVLWYRKTFFIPKIWNEDHVWLEFDGSFRNTTVWLDGKLVLSHESGYTPFLISLDEFIIHNDNYDDNDNDDRKNHTIAVFVDPDNGDGGGPGRGSGWWYEGGGLYRNVWLNRARKTKRIQDVFVYTNEILLENPRKALWATLHGNLTLLLDGESEQDLCVDLTISNDQGFLLNDTEIMLLDIRPAQEEDTFSYQYQVKLIFPQVWSTSRPYLYHIEVFLRDCETGNTLDSVSTYHGIRTIQYTPDRGFFLNQQPFKIRGFCDHNTFGVVGTYIF
jgi:beta-galactosidase/beta-glucuronidase